MSNEWDDFGRMCQRAGGSMGVGSKDYPSLSAATRQPTPVQSEGRLEKLGTGLVVGAGVVAVTGMGLSRFLAALAPGLRGFGRRLTFGGAAMMAVPEIQRLEVDLGLRANVSPLAVDVGQAGAVAGGVGLLSEGLGFLLGNPYTRWPLMFLIVGACVMSTVNNWRSYFRGGAGYNVVHTSQVYDASDHKIDLQIVSKDGYWADQYGAACLVTSPTGDRGYIHGQARYLGDSGFLTPPNTLRTITFKVDGGWMYGTPTHCEISERIDVDEQLANYLGFKNTYDANLRHFLN